MLCGRGVAVFRFCEDFQMRRTDWAAIGRTGPSRQPSRTEPCQCASGQPWAYPGALQGQMQFLQCTKGVVCTSPGALAGLGRWFVGGAVLPVCGDFKRRRQHSATFTHRALPVCEWPAVGMPWGTARSNAVPAVHQRCGLHFTWGFGRAGQVVWRGCGFACLWRFAEKAAALGNQSAQSPVSEQVASPRHAMGHCKHKSSFCIVQ